MPLPAPDWTPAQLAKRSGLNVSALHFYEREGLIDSTRTAGNQRRYARDTVRRLAFIRAAVRVGVPLTDIRLALTGLPAGRTPTAADWEQLSESWRAELDTRIAMLTRLRDDLGGCIRCGCLSLERCALFNPGDEYGGRHPGRNTLVQTWAGSIARHQSSGAEGKGGSAEAPDP
ncbi:redox-sensitive transcriptional activator SoxR [Deinococcus humi]|uniref:MerR family redox-sensitive transcriptional activator SoxR n=1 Tax=Deinococcus humi TaxID=662880 RepID=A0A7W8JY07_9DEIO|nr:redox-sensitive transcriptional activator SoxR [Deinococcus humi]MBB5365317.1 MerR family redox-sensitive transcriptional activator SoxR [Deinococcus humi]GGO36356.1 redox-sensitive transcriptional activator SoxR [Deinococcus humi]